MSFSLTFKRLTLFNKIVKLNNSGFFRKYSSFTDSNFTGDLPTSSEKTKWTKHSVRLGAIARKRGMSALWDEWGVRHPVTILQLDKVQVVQIKKNSKYVKPPLVAVQIGCTEKKVKGFTRPLLGHFRKAGVSPKKKLLEFHVTPDAVLSVGTEIKAAHFVPGQYVDVTAPSIGKGFAGVMKRWNFRGLPASHGTSLTHRSAGSTGQNQDPGKVFKGKKMAGRLGVYVKGGVPGFDDQYVKIRDAIKKPGGKCFPSDCIPPPFPTIDPEIANNMPRELMAKTGGVDPFMSKEV
ncbi:mitochondrial 50S ribosomal protein L3 [Rhizophagus clarus]|uniref:Large ribosomal subunit protein uL3m n=1 Tax=Rhizophagus clarus TaxID=94130 RepID=A0A8H3QG94_9GLOM|nr:mitochondrial 50S ribosomal protein L3 [Rhizophagus clarus]